MLAFIQLTTVEKEIKILKKKLKKSYKSSQIEDKVLGSQVSKGFSLCKVV